MLSVHRALRLDSGVTFLVSRSLGVFSAMKNWVLKLRPYEVIGVHRFFFSSIFFCCLAIGYVAC